MLSPRLPAGVRADDFAPGAALQHTVLHVIALAGNVALVALGAGTLYEVTLGLQLALLAGAALAGVAPLRVLLIARYYVLTTASSAAGLWDWLRHGTPAWWEAAEGTR
jgi:hypothetical protein